MALPHGTPVCKLSRKRSPCPPTRQPVGLPLTMARPQGHELVASKPDQSAVTAEALFGPCGFFWFGLQLKKKLKVKGAWAARPGKRSTSAQVMISRLVGSSPA